MSPSRVERYRTLLAGQPENLMFRFSLAQALEAAGEVEAAAEHYARCAQGRADWMLPRILLGKLHLAAGRREQALPLLQEALRLAEEQAHDDPAGELRALLAETDPAAYRA
jgi:tetratricopeptide (TPR) repeat protein